VVYSFQDVRNALDAIVRCDAVDEAYPVAALFGWHELFPGCVYRKEIWMEITTAREIVKRAKADETFDGPIPEDDATCISEAQDLVEMAEQAWAQHIRGPEVEAILKLAAGADGDGAEPDTAESDVGSEEPEAEEKEKPAGSPPSALTDAPEALQKSEPWDGYGEYRVADVTNGLNWYFDNDAENILDLLRHVWAYEVAHKERARILEFVVEMWQRAGGEFDASEVEAEEEAQPEPEPEEAEAESDAEAGEADSSDAEAEPESEARAEASERRVDEAESPAKDKPSGQQGAYRKLIEIVERELKNERLDGIPKPPQEDAPTLPWKWADVTNGELQDMHMQFAAFAYYKGYVRARDERIAMHCKEAADELYNKLLVSAPKYDEKGKEIRVTILEAEISSDDNVKRWRKLQRKHEALATQAKQEQESYGKLVEALSRLETMRHNAWERARK
jgi:hypothetical protein